MEIIFLGSSGSILESYRWIYKHEFPPMLFRYYFGENFPVEPLFMDAFMMNKIAAPCMFVF